MSSSLDGSSENLDERIQKEIVRSALRVKLLERAIDIASDIDYSGKDDAVSIFLEKTKIIFDGFFKIYDENNKNVRRFDTPNIPVEETVHDDYIISLENGKKYKTLGKHILALGMKPSDYRRKWGLPFDYPMVCKEYAERRSIIAKKFSLGKTKG
jgi:predicted transcriptional regulator